MSVKKYANNIFKSDFDGFKDTENMMQQVLGLCVYNFPDKLLFSDIPNLIKNGTLDVNETDEAVLKWKDNISKSEYCGYKINFF